MQGPEARNCDVRKECLDEVEEKESGDAVSYREENRQFAVSTSRRAGAVAKFLSHRGRWRDGRTILHDVHLSALSLHRLEFSAGGLEGKGDAIHGLQLGVAAGDRTTARSATY